MSRGLSPIAPYTGVPTGVWTLPSRATSHRSSSPHSLRANSREPAPSPGAVARFRTPLSHSGRSRCRRAPSPPCRNWTVPSGLPTTTKAPRSPPSAVTVDTGRGASSASSVRQPSDVAASRHTRPSVSPHSTPASSAVSAVTTRGIRRVQPSGIEPILPSRPLLTSRLPYGPGAWASAVTPRRCTGRGGPSGRKPGSAHSRTAPDSSPTARRPESSGARASAVTPASPGRLTPHVRAPPTSQHTSRPVSVPTTTTSRARTRPMSRAVTRCSSGSTNSCSASGSPARSTSTRTRPPCSPVTTTSPPSAKWPTAAQAISGTSQGAAVPGRVCATVHAVPPGPSSGSHGPRRRWPGRGSRRRRGSHRAPVRPRRAR